MKILESSFYDQPTIDLAKALLGKVLVHESPDGTTAGIIVEDEAYGGTGDPAAHASHGCTERTKVLFGPPGHVYTYLIYGMHICFNVSANIEGEAGCVLIRALEPVSGIDLMQQRRGNVKPQDLASGPGKLAKAMDIDMSFYGHDLTRKPLFIAEYAAKECNSFYSDFTISSGPRIGIKRATERPWRFWIQGC